MLNYNDPINCLELSVPTNNHQEELRIDTIDEIKDLHWNDLDGEDNFDCMGNSPHIFNGTQQCIRYGHEYADTVSIGT